VFLRLFDTIEYHFRHISNLPQPRGWEKKIAEGPPCVVLASPGFMQTGPSRELFELWAPDSRNGLVITGYSIEGTLARVSDKWLVFEVDYLLSIVFSVYTMKQWTLFPWL
jgi:Cft2 family RNA processing exonuclease